MEFITLPSPAKLNRFLHIVGRYENGYHQLQTIFHLIAHFDTLHFNLRKDSKIKVNCKQLKLSPEYNLVYKAAQLLQTRFKLNKGVDIVLEKNIPWGAGLGGGSSNAATTLLALNALWKLNLTREELKKMGLQLGADVSVFIQGESSWAEGVGELLTPLKLPETEFLVIIPRVQISTVEIYLEKTLARNTPVCNMSETLIDEGHNDLEKVVRLKYKEVDKALVWLNQYGQARLTGSGSGIFIANPDRDYLEKVGKKVPKAWRYFISTGLNVSPINNILTVI